MVELQVLDKDKKSGRVSFLLKGTNPAFANAMRRAMLESVPTMAVEDVEFRKNSSILYDEIIAHRLGLVPLKTDLKSYVLPSKCKCEGKGCNRCSLKLTLKAKGPGVVYASEIKSKDPKVKPVYPEMPIAKLAKGQELEIEMTAVLGVGRNHVKWSPGLVWYKAKPIITIDDKKCTNAEDCAKACPVNVYNYKDGKITINKENLMLCHMCNACSDIAANKSITVSKSDDEFVFYIEPWGQLTAVEIATTAAEMFKETLAEFEEKIK
ncbi:MAG: DNA-directed RNA polymerase subunit D [Candidatus Woesearchaeota archaeon]